MKRYRIIHLFLFFVLHLSFTARTDSTMNLTQKQWKAISKGYDYTETFDSPKLEKHNEKVFNPTHFDLGAYAYLIYFLVFVLVVFLAVKLFGNFKNTTALKEKKISVESIEKLEEKIHEVNLDDLLKEALSTNNYRLALRLNFLIIIKLLSQKGKIDWAKEKTNWEYYNELKDQIMAEQFKEIIMSFENFWYGEHLLTEFQYHHTAPLYAAMQKQLTTRHE